MLDYNKRLVEVSVILNHLSESDYNKIPKEVIKKIETNKDKEYVWIYDETKDLKEQNVSRDTLAILSYINMEYLLNEKQKDFAKGVFKKNQQKVEEEKRKKYDPNDLFKNKKVNEENNEQIQTSSVSMIEVKESIIKRILNIIKKILNKKINKKQ